MKSKELHLDYISLTGKLLEKLGEGIPKDKENDEDTIYLKLKDCIKEIKEITALVKTSGLYEDSREDSELFYKTNYEILPTKKQKCLQAYHHFLDRVVSSPTRVHIRGVIILTIPILEKCLELPE